jgi:hypothetical protein
LEGTFFFFLVVVVIVIVVFGISMGIIKVWVE